MKSSCSEYQKDDECALSPLNKTRSYESRPERLLHCFNLGIVLEKGGRREKLGGVVETSCRSHLAPPPKKTQGN